MALHDPESTAQVINISDVACLDGKENCRISLHSIKFFPLLISVGKSDRVENWPAKEDPNHRRTASRSADWGR